jgi:putative Mg2+ transporter-C (MgtC) family protein
LGEITTFRKLINMELGEFVLKVGLAVIAGVFIGAEREYRGKSAGLRTNALVALGACVFILISLNFREAVNVDVTRVLGQVVTGIGFIGAGTILHHGTKVEGLTTAATIWCSAGAGCLAATGMFKELAVITIFVIIINFVFSFFEVKLRHRRNTFKSKES